MTAPQTTQKKELLYPQTAVGLENAVKYFTAIMKLVMELIGFGLNGDEKESRDTFVKFSRKHLQSVSEGVDENPLYIGRTIGAGMAFMKRLETRMSEFLSASSSSFQKKIVEIQEVDAPTYEAVASKIGELMIELTKALAEVASTNGDERIAILGRQVRAHTALVQFLRTVESNALTARFRAGKHRERVEVILPAANRALSMLDELDSQIEISA